MIAPEGSLVFHEKAWNAYPYCRTGKFGSRNKPSSLSHGYLEFTCFSLFILNALQALLMFFFFFFFFFSRDGELLSISDL